jgi:hypothetical protein
MLYTIQTKISQWCMAEISEHGPAHDPLSFGVYKGMNKDMGVQAKALLKNKAFLIEHVDIAMLTKCSKTIWPKALCTLAPKLNVGRVPHVKWAYDVAKTINVMCNHVWRLEQDHRWRQAIKTLSEDEIMDLAHLRDKCAFPGFGEAEAIAKRKEFWAKYKVGTVATEKHEHEADNEEVMPMIEDTGSNRKLKQQVSISSEDSEHLHKHRKRKLDIDHRLKDEPRVMPKISSHAGSTGKVKQETAKDREMALISDVIKAIETDDEVAKTAHATHNAVVKRKGQEDPACQRC